jgi:hypothetical protein
MATPLQPGGAWPGNGPLPIGGAPPGAPPQQGLHPTVSYGQPGGQQAVVLPRQQTPSQQKSGAPSYGVQYDPSQIPPAPQAPQQQWAAPQPQQWPQQQPPQQGSWQAPQAPPAPSPAAYGQQPPASPQQGAYSQRAQLDSQTILDGPGVPQELRGRPVGQVMQIYTALAQDWLQRQGHTRAAGQAPANQPAPQPTAQLPQRPASGTEGAWSWQNPEPHFRSIVGDEIEKRLGGVVQQTQAQAIAQARLTAQQGIPDFQNLEGEIMQMLTGASPEVLSNPQVWESAADMVRGRVARRGQFGGQAPQGPQVQGPSVPGYQGGTPRAVPAGSYAVPQYQYFTEGPTPPSQYNPQQGLSHEQMVYAQRMGMSPQDYMAWMGGVQR